MEIRLFKKSLFYKALEQAALIGEDLNLKEETEKLDLDSDDWLIGRQVFQLVNTLFQSDPNDLWLLYLNNIIWDPTCRCPLANSDGQIDPNILN